METEPLIDKNSNKNLNILHQNGQNYKSFNSTNQESANQIELEWNQVIEGAIHAFI